MSTTRWTDDKGISDLSVAIDEIYFLRALLADEAGILEAHLGYATFPKSRRRFAEESVERMKRAARGGTRKGIQREKFDAQKALRRIDAPVSLTNSQWAAQRGLTPVEQKNGDDE